MLESSLYSMSDLDLNKDREKKVQRLPSRSRALPRARKRAHVKESGSASPFTPKRSLFYALLASLIIVIFASCGADAPPAIELPDDLNVKVERAEDVEILYSDSAQVKVRITGPTMLNNLDRTEPYQEFVDGVLVEFYGNDQKVNSTLVANYAIRFDRKGEIIVRDSVVWESVDQQRLETEELIWDENDEQVYTQKFARISTSREIIYGHGFRANQDFSNARIQQVEGIVTIDEPQ